MKHLKLYEELTEFTQDLFETRTRILFDTKCLVPYGISSDDRLVAYDLSKELLKQILDKNNINYEEIDLPEGIEYGPQKFAVILEGNWTPDEILDLIPHGGPTSTDYVIKLHYWEPGTDDQIVFKEEVDADSRTKWMAALGPGPKLWDWRVRR